MFAIHDRVPVKWRADVQAERVVELHVGELRRAVRGVTQARFGPQGESVPIFVMDGPMIDRARTR